MIDALAEVVTAGIPVEFVMVGDGPLRAEIEAYAHQRLPDVKFFNQLSQSEIVDLLASAQLYLHGSITLDNGHAEAFGLANIEAQAVGTPVVAFDSGGVAEAMEPGKTGLAVGERDTKAMSEAIARLLKDQEMWTSFSREADAMVPRRFAINAQTALLEEFYEQVLERHAAHAGQLRSAA
jgi:glycosyltransferase involved in cell wall biosynthesis